MALLSDEKLLEQFDRHREISESGLAYQKQKAEEAHAFAAGNEEFYRNGEQSKSSRMSVIFNKIKPFVDSVKGLMIQLRRKPQYVARMMDSEKQREYSSYMSSINDYMRNNANMDQLESRQDFEMLVAGFGATDTNITYDKNPDGEVCSELIKFKDVFWDPQAIEPNLLDSRWVYRRKSFSLEEALKRFSGTDESDFESYDDDEEYAQYQRINPVFLNGQDEDLVEVNYYQYWSLETYYRILNPIFNGDLTSDENEMLGSLLFNIKEVMEEAATDEEVEDLFEFDPLNEYLIVSGRLRSTVLEAFSRFDLDVEEQKYLRKVYYTALISGRKVLKKFKSPDQMGFTIKFKTGSYDPTEKFWFGMVLGMINPARYECKALTEMLYSIAANSKGGVMYEESAVTDPARFEQQYATTDAAISVADGALSGGRIQPKAIPHMQNGYEGIYQISGSSLEHAVGIRREFLGMSENSQVSALLEAQRINQVVTSLAGYFDSITLYQKEHARMMTTFIKMLAENSEERLVSLIGEDGSKRYEKLSKDKIMDEYDIDIIEAPNTPQQKQETAQVVLQLARELSQQGKDIYPLVIDYIPGISEPDKQNIKKALVPSEEAQAANAEAQKRQLEEEMALKESVIKAQEANAIKDVAEAEKKKAEIDKVYADTVKTIKEAEQKSLENEILKEESIQKVSLVV